MVYPSLTLLSCEGDFFFMPHKTVHPGRYQNRVHRPSPNLTSHKRDGGDWLFVKSRPVNFHFKAFRRVAVFHTLEK